MYLRLLMWAGVKGVSWARGAEAFSVEVGMVIFDYATTFRVAFLFRPYTRHASPKELLQAEIRTDLEGQEISHLFSLADC